MFNNTTMPSLADIAAVTNNDGMNGSGWWILIILFAIFGGFGGNWGNNNAAGAYDNYVLSSDFASLQRQIDSQTADLKQATTSIGNGLSSLGYDQLNQINGINSNIANLGFQMQQCCCDNKSAIAQLRYDDATNTCAITTAINNAAQQIMQNDNNNYRQLHDENVAIQMAAKDDRIAALTAQINALNLAASQQAQNAYLIDQLGGNRCSSCC